MRLGRQAFFRQNRLGSTKVLKHHALARFASLPRYVRFLWMVAGFEALTLAMRALGS
jgi:hypothetical protein